MDSEELETWLKTRPREDAILIAQRAALRVFPIWATQIEADWARKHDFKCARLLRCYLTAGVARKFVTSSVIAASSGAAYTTATAAATASASKGGSYGASNAARAAARTARTGAAFADATFAVATFAALAVSDADHAARYISIAELWSCTQQDVAILEAGVDLISSPLWRDGPSKRLRQLELRSLEILAREIGSLDSFWHRWYLAAIKGEWLDWELQHKVALIPEYIWKQGPKAVIAAIDEIEADHAAVHLPDETGVPPPTYRYSEPTRLDAERLLHAAIADFTFSEIRQLMEMLPFGEDIARLSEPAALARFLGDADTARHSIETLCSAFAAEGGVLQGAGTIKTYLNEVLQELSKARQLGSLNVGWLIECGEVLQAYARSQTYMAELMGLSIPLQRSVRRLETIAARHFAATLLRFAPLKDIQSREDTRLGDLMEDVRRGLRVIRETPAEALTPMAPEGLAVFDKMLASIERSIRDEFMTSDPQMRSSLRREIDFRLAQVSVSLMLYLEKAPTRLKQLERLVQIIGTVEKGKGSLEKLIGGFKDLLP